MQVGVEKFQHFFVLRFGTPNEITTHSLAIAITNSSEPV